MRYCLVDKRMKTGDLNEKEKNKKVLLFKLPGMNITNKQINVYP